ncbi:MAG: prolipoprotein diacylglyceryl transferase [Oscillospiraceae bacterium]|jgi:phosphatidylglycerol:prolipoprotein diacylglycerol transferase|nr:prolipoprotein diacylglyceryl transferase [Oscillospiraceae bacterium]
MHPFLSLFGRQISSYGLMAVLGCALAGVLVLLRCRRLAFPRADAVNLFVLCIVGALIGAKLTFLLTNIPRAVRHWTLVAARPWDSFLALSGGLVFYGGVIGGFLAALWYLRRFRLPFAAAADLFAPAIPAGHMLGRVGCFLGGCCYGAEASWGPVFRHSPLLEANGVPRLPVQLFEAAGNLLICLVLLWYERRPHVPGRTLALYLLLYAPLRFALEFFRGDAARGFAFGVSTSQWISVLLFAAGLLWLSRRAPVSPGPAEPAGVARAL